MGLGEDGKKIHYTFARPTGRLYIHDELPPRDGKPMEGRSTKVRECNQAQRGQDVKEVGKAA